MKRVCAFLLLLTIGGCGTSLDSNSLNGDWRITGTNGGIGCIHIVDGEVIGYDDNCTGVYEPANSPEPISVSNNRVVTSFTTVANSSIYAFTIDVTGQGDGTYQGQFTGRVDGGAPTTFDIIMVRR